MKSIRLAVFGLILLVGMAGVAHATPVVSGILFSFGSDSGMVGTPAPSGEPDFPWLVTVTETSRRGWTVIGTDALLHRVTPVYAISEGKIVIGGDDPSEAVFSGLVKGSPFTLDMDIEAGSERYGRSHSSTHFSFKATLPDIGDLGEWFSPEGPYEGTLKFTAGSCRGRIESGCGPFRPVPVPPSFLLLAPALTGLMMGRRLRRTGMRDR